MSRPTSRVSRVLMTGPLAPFAAAYEQELRARGYTRLSVVAEARQVAQLSRWLEAGRLAAAELSLARIEEFVEFQRAAGRFRSQWSRPGLLCLLDVLRRMGVAAEEVTTPVVSPRAALLGRFERYELTERGLVAGTVRGYVGHAGRFLDGLGPVALADVTAAEVIAAVMRESSTVSVSTTQNFVAGLRAFLRFGFIEGLVAMDLSQAALPVTGRRRSSLPRGISKADAVALLDSCDRRSAIGRRDFAVLVTLLQLGLRRGELAALRLDDVDWRNGELVVRGKGRREDRLPLPAEVGEAIAGYLRRGRPATDRREVFLRARAPLGPIDAGTVSSTVRRACRRAGIAEVGAHRLRHTTACDMLAAGVPLAQIAQVLRHRSLQSTAVYARVDIEQLRLLAAPWPTTGVRP